MNAILHTISEQIKNISILLNPIIPISTKKVLDTINLSDKDISIDNIKKNGVFDYNLDLKNLDILFKKIENDNWFTLPSDLRTDVERSRRNNK